ncbi:MAG: hypothetical protein ACP5Q1_12710 [Anaerolineae bacterium]
MESEIFDEIRQLFHYLFDEYGFALAIEQRFESFGNWVVVLRSDKCGRIRIMQDRGEVFLALGPQWSPVSWDVGPWYSLDVVVRYLSDGHDRFESTLGQTEQQIERLAEQLRRYVSPACELFQKDMFEEKRGELDALRQKVEDEVWERLLGKGQSPQ